MKKKITLVIILALSLLMCSCRTPRVITAGSDGDAKTPLTFESVKQILGKSYVVPSIENEFNNARISSTYIHIYYNCPISQEIIDEIEKSLTENYSDQKVTIRQEKGKYDFDLTDEGEIIHICNNAMNHNNMMMLIRNKDDDVEKGINQIQDEYFSSYDSLFLTNEMLDEFGLDEPSQRIDIFSDGTSSISLFWSVEIEPALNLYKYYLDETDIFPLGYSYPTRTTEDGAYLENGDELILTISPYDGYQGPSAQIYVERKFQPKYKVKFP